MSFRHSPIVFVLMFGAAFAEDDLQKPLKQGDVTQGTLKASEARAVKIETPPGSYVRGRFDGRNLRVTLLDDSGKPERVLIAHGGIRQEFQFMADGRSTCRLELRPVGESEESYSLEVESVVPPSAQKAPRVVLESPRLRTLQETLADGGTTDAFWDEVKQRNRGPLVERDGAEPPLEPGTSLVTFLWRGAKRNVRLFGAPSNDHDEMKRLGDSDVWYGSYRVPDSARVTYKFAPDVPELDAPFMIRRRAILATAQRDPFNPLSVPPRELPDKYAGESLVELPGAIRQPWLDLRSEVKPGTVERRQIRSEVLGNVRDVYLYRPHGYVPGAGENALLVAFDGDRYVDQVEAPRALDNLIAARAIPPTAALFLANATAESRSVELPPNPKFVRFLADELIPWARRQNISATAGSTVVAGASYGGLAAAYAGWTRPDVFGKVFSQSGSFWWAPGAGPGGGNRQVEPEWLTRQIAESPLRPVRFYLEAGVFEVGQRGDAGILQTTRHLRDVLKARGYAVDHAEPAGAHGYDYWRYSFPDGLVALLGKQAAGAK